jgi:hypothetical protein
LLHYHCQIVYNVIYIDALPLQTSKHPTMVGVAFPLPEIVYYMRWTHDSRDSREYFLIGTFISFQLIY